MVSTESPVAAEAAQLSTRLPNNPTSDEATTLQEVTLFPKLPIELRLRICGFSARGSGPRTIEVEFDVDLTYKMGNPGYRNMRGATYAHVDYQYRYSAPTERLGVLSACQENRQEVKKLNPRRLGYKKGQTIVFNAARNAIFFHFPSIFYLMMNSERENDARNFHGFSDIQNLALRFPCPDDIEGVSDLKDQLFTGLKGKIATLKSLLSLSAAKKIVRSDIKVKHSDLIAKANLLSSQVQVVHEFESSANFDLDMLFSPQIF